MSDSDDHIEETGKRRSQRERLQDKQNTRRRQGRSNKKNSGRRISHNPDDY